jgi:ankyrin repeat protein
VVQLLLEAGAQLHYSPQGRSTPLYVAAKEGRLEVVQLLLAAGAEVTYSILTEY